MSEEETVWGKEDQSRALDNQDMGQVSSYWPTVMTGLQREWRAQCSFLLIWFWTLHQMEYMDETDVHLKCVYTSDC